MPLGRFIDMRALRQQVPFSKTEIYRRINAGTFPRPIKIGPKRVAFLESEILDWMASCIQERDGGREERSAQGRRAATGVKRGKRG